MSAALLTRGRPLLQGVAEFGQVKVKSTEYADDREGVNPHQAIDFEMTVDGKDEPIRLALYLNSNNKTRATQGSDFKHSGGTFANHQDAKTLIIELMNQAKQKNIDLHNQDADSLKVAISTAFNSHVGELFYRLKRGFLRTDSGALGLGPLKLNEVGSECKSYNNFWSLASPGS